MTSEPSTPSRKSICYFYAKNASCTKGDDCTFSHDIPASSAPLRKRSASLEPDRMAGLSPHIVAKIKAGLHKTRICIHYVEKRCWKGEHCAFLHVSGPDALNLIYALNKTKLCPWVKYTGDCTSGHSCVFSHSQLGVGKGKEADKQSWRKKEKSADKTGTSVAVEGLEESPEESEGSPIKTKAADHLEEEGGDLEVEQQGTAAKPQKDSSGGGAGGLAKKDDVFVIDMASEDAAELLDKFLLNP